MKPAHRKKIGKGYVNPFRKQLHRSAASWLAFCMGLYKDTYPRPQIPKNFSYPQINEKVSAEAPKVTWVNHSTFLVEVDGLNLLTDPIWSKRCSPVSFLGPKRSHDPGISMKGLPKIDMVLISHNHYDHLDKPTVKELHKKYPDILWKIPKGMRRWFKRLGITNVIEFDWWDQKKVEGHNLSITAVPTQHFSGRHPFNNNKTPWNGYVMQFHDKGKTFYFVGDTGYNNVHFNEIGSAFDKIDLSLIPIGTYAPKKFMSPVHISPDEAVNIHREVGSKLSVGSHYHTFPLSKEKRGQPPFDLYLAMEEAELDHNTFRVLQPGQTINW